ncbi:MAG: HEPN domain-containing protein [Pigmentiphaga sp.]|uniref:HEPN domain-containing protein n=1 Tax=Pseudomonadaceae TaxID=135621 RepID=UPI001F440561|nr:HEPN domain-containing protein [Stutzerimonas kunmingensis]MCF6752154.1 HEPN domain-containing protein [Stutzerimonas stutzeri]
MASRNLKLRKSIAPMLESIDAIQAEKGTSLHLRPFEAADLIVRHSIVKVEGDADKDNFIEKPWFAAIYAEIHKWYVARYGSLMKVQRDNATGLVVHRGVPHTIDVPKTISALQESGLVKLTFPSKLYPTEDPMKWVRPKISKRSIGPLAGKLRNRIACTCNGLRQIGLNTGTAGGKNTGVPLMATSIVAHLSKAAEAASSHYKESNSLALWDLHLACEKSIKSLLAQRNVQFPKTHDLAKLNDLVPDLDVRKKAHRIIRHLPNEKKVIQHRYLQEAAVPPNKLYVFYSLALRLCVIYTSGLTQKLQIADASFFLKEPPWFSQME